MSLGVRALRLFPSPLAHRHAKTPAPLPMQSERSAMGRRAGGFWRTRGLSSWRRYSAAGRLGLRGSGASTGSPWRAFSGVMGSVRT